MDLDGLGEDLAAGIEVSGAGDLGLGISTTFEILLLPVVLETLGVFGPDVTFAEGSDVSLEPRWEEADGWLVEAGCAVTLGADVLGKPDAGDFVSGRLVETVAGDFDSTEDLPVEVFDCVAVVGEEGWEACDDAAGVGKRMPQKPATGSVNSNST
jgi:hypothetical protein